MEAISIIIIQIILLFFLCFFILIIINENRKMINIDEKEVIKQVKKVAKRLL